MGDAKEPGRVESEINEILARSTGGPGATPAPQGARDPLDRELRQIKEVIVRMGSLTEAAIRDALTALTTHDAQLAETIIVNDRNINVMQHEVISVITTTIATQSPVARDLRNLLTMNHVAYELERIADHASSVAKVAKQLAPEPALQRYLHLPEIGELAAAQLHGVLLALVDSDAVRARQVAVSDDQIDALYRKSFDECVLLMEADKGNVERGTRLLFAAHYLERIGDRTTNIAEDIVYLVSGEVEDLNP
jgi:phosphate transport system protein